MAEKPTSLPQWATDGGTVLEPDSGQKATGFQPFTKAPAQWMNWVLNLIYQWTQYLDAPVGTGAGAGLAATGGNSSGTGLSGTGGASDGIGVDGQGDGSGAGVRGTGGETGLGVQGIGGATSGAGVRGTATAGNSSGGVFFGQGSGAGVEGTGGGTNGPGGQFSGGATNGRGLNATGSGSGAGVRGTGGATGVGVQGFGGSTSGVGVSGVATAGNSDGGGFTGSGSGAGVAGTGGGSNGPGGEFTGGATNGRGVSSTGSGSGTGVRGTGGASSGIGVHGIGGASDGIGVSGQGTGTGSGGEFVGGATGYGAVIQADTSSPARAALRVVPQNADPSSSPDTGDAYVHATSGLPSIRKAGSEWARIPGKVFAGTNSSDTRTSSGTFAQSYSIPANTLRVGSTIRIRAAGRTTAATSGTGSMALKFLGTNILAEDPGIAVSTNNRFAMEAEIVIRSVGGSGSYASYGMAVSSDAGGGAGGAVAESRVNTIDTTAAASITVDASISATATLRLDHLTVEICD